MCDTINYGFIKDQWISSIDNFINSVTSVAYTGICTHIHFDMDAKVLTLYQKHKQPLSNEASNKQTYLYNNARTLFLYIFKPSLQLRIAFG